jgi:hypothetical protein
VVFAELSPTINFPIMLICGKQAGDEDIKGQSDSQLNFDEALRNAACKRNFRISGSGHSEPLL